MSEQQRQRLPARLLWPPIIFLIFGLLVTMGATLTMAETSRARAALRFANSVGETRAAIAERLQVHISLLRGVAGLFASGAPVDRDSFRSYVERLGLSTNYPGAQGVGFSALLRPEDRATLTVAKRIDIPPDVRLWPDFPRDQYHAIVLLEPLDRRNRRALGFDMYTEPARNEAMARARDTGAPATSGAVVLVQEIDAEKQTGFLIYLPVYERGPAPTTIEERRARLLGFAYSPFRADDLFRGIFADREGEQAVAFEIYDGTAARPEAVLHRSPHFGAKSYRPTFTATETITVAGRPWTIVYTSQPAFDAAGDALVAPLAAAAGVVLTLILFGVAWAQARARYEAELAVRARDTFLSVASHELKTPLTSLYGNAQLLQRRMTRADTVGDRERNNVATIVEQSRRLSKLIDDLLDHSRLQKGRLSISRERVDLGAILNRVADELRPGLSRHMLNVSLPDKPLPVLGDAMRLEQVLFNLISNAVKYSPRGGIVEVRAAREEPWALVTVTDHGIGIPSASLPQLFTPFFRAPNAVSNQIGGMGIGLSVVKELVERHGGTLAVESEEGLGSTFTVCLPLADAEPPAATPAHQADPQVRLRE
jgi:signal transduction histidine kinase